MPTVLLPRLQSSNIVRAPVQGCSLLPWLAASVCVHAISCTATRESLTGRVCCNGRRPLLLAPQYTWGMEAHAFGEPGSLEYQLMYCRKGARRPGDAPVHFLGPGTRAGAARGAAESPTHEHMDCDDYLLRSEL